MKIINLLMVNKLVFLDNRIYWTLQFLPQLEHTTNVKNYLGNPELYDGIEIDELNIKQFRDT